MVECFCLLCLHQLVSWSLSDAPPCLSRRHLYDSIFAWSCMPLSLCADLHLCQEDDFLHLFTLVSYFSSSRFLLVIADKLFVSLCSSWRAAILESSSFGGQLLNSSKSHPRCHCPGMAYFLGHRLSFHLAISLMLVWYLARLPELIFSHYILEFLNLFWLITKALLAIPPLGFIYPKLMALLLSEYIPVSAKHNAHQTMKSFHLINPLRCQVIILLQHDRFLILLSRFEALFLVHHQNFARLFLLHVRYPK